MFSKEERNKERNVDELIPFLEEKENEKAALVREHELFCRETNSCFESEEAKMLIEIHDDFLTAEMFKIQETINFRVCCTPLPWSCFPATLERLKSYQAQRDQRKMQEEQRKRERQIQEEQREQARELRRKEQLEETRQAIILEKRVRRSLQDQRLISRANTKYSFTSFCIKIGLGFALGLFILPQAFILITVLTLLAVIGAHKHRHAVINAGKHYQFPEDLENLDGHFQARVAALHAGIKAKTWKGYAESFSQPLTYYRFNREFKAGMIQAMTENKPVMDAVEKYARSSM